MSELRDHLDLLIKKLQRGAGSPALLFLDFAIDSFLLTLIGFAAAQAVGVVGAVVIGIFLWTVFSRLSLYTLLRFFIGRGELKIDEPDKTEVDLYSDK